ncbi:RNA polymerase sigma factor [Sporosarcina sp. FSL K6-1522]|uniref:RNA polymerase sigma factor n=1 Tax=Sporosarcina sp. FSL K6-1522 TaxID=2921554 RepID=UPI00315AF562
MHENAEKREQIEQWYDEYSVPIFKYIAKMVKDFHQAEDLTQDTFIKAYNYQSTDKDIKYPKTFLYKIAHNLTIDHLRKQAPIQLIKDFFWNYSSREPSTESIVEIQEDAKELYRALEKLKSTYRQVIILRQIEAFSTKETAHILGWSEGKVKTTLYRAMLKLEEQLQKEMVMNESP